MLAISGVWEILSAAAAQAGRPTPTLLPAAAKQLPRRHKRSGDPGDAMSSASTVSRASAYRSRASSSLQNHGSSTSLLLSMLGHHAGLSAKTLDHSVLKDGNGICPAVSCRHAAWLCTEYLASARCFLASAASACACLTSLLSPVPVTSPDGGTAVGCEPPSDTAGCELPAVEVGSPPAAC